MKNTDANRLVVSRRERKEDDVSIQDEKDRKVRFLLIQGLAGLLNVKPC